VHTPYINKALINGCTRWLNHTPFIQLTDRYTSKDSFWFTFFHEAGHIILHGKKDIFLENLDYSDKDLHKEEEANEFACKWTLKDRQIKKLIPHSLEKEYFEPVAFE
jgi:Zn-dependent peptidase ImmA (M78 family)